MPPNQRLRSTWAQRAEQKGFVAGGKIKPGVKAGAIVDWLKDEYDLGASGYVPPAIDRVAEIVAMFDRNVAAAAEAFKRQGNDRLLAKWQLKKSGQLVVEMPRMGMIRALLMNHLIHHRGQLSVYLRLQNVPLPSIYGPTADEPM